MTHGVLGLDPDRSSGAGRDRRRSVGIGVALLVVLLALAWLVVREPFAASKPVTEAEARAFLDRAVGLGRARDFEGLCALNGSVANCEFTLDQGARETVPDEKPTSVHAYFAPEGDGNDTPGWVLTVRGRDGRGQSYDTQVMVFRDDEGDLTAINIVWWSGARLIVGDDPIQSAAPVTPDH